MDDDREIWDEFRWEEFMKEQDKMVERYMELFERYQNDPNRDEIIAHEMGWDKFPENKEWEDAMDYINECENCEDGEEWKKLMPSDRNNTSLKNEFDSIPVCRISKEFAIRALQLADTLPASNRENPSVVSFVSNALIASAKVAGGTDMGDDIDDLGANIAFCKRGLAASNIAIDALQKMKDERIISGSVYLKMVNEATEVRNEIAKYILDLREKFRSGLPH